MFIVHQGRVIICKAGIRKYELPSLVVGLFESTDRTSVEGAANFRVSDNTTESLPRTRHRQLDEAELGFTDDLEDNPLGHSFLRLDRNGTCDRQHGLQSSPC
jgi:hypothetical protein